ncbi:hypothetical protein A5893_04020 [Pedobacter psychrophilus]|uniref:DUF3347 domain-containing protein n=1 Tax=Pedobacter psychrophilus TaxID=1826909 RepID=A0A179DMK9_9SPHI|nr:DUF3347 domain-containing protein [Pedobacter psychrophilus]OAQ42287.1 hypothetical protein A5893_04020 [Pedobacter psychrophilus]
MNKIILTIVIGAIAFVGCNQGSKTIQLNPSEEKTTVFESKPLIDNYLAIENSLVMDDSKTAADAAKTLVEAIKSFDEKLHNAKQINVFRKIKDNAIQHSQKITENIDNIENQREHFKMLSENIYDYAKVADLPAPVYKINCPMYKDGSFWLSKTKEVKNPFYGDKMISCGDVKETIQ